MTNAQTDRYHIRVRGQLDKRWADWFDGMEMIWSEAYTDLAGPVPDQARLHGMLAKLRDLGLFLVFVKFIEIGDDP